MYSVSHKVEISERFKSLRLEFKGQNSNLKHVEKNDKRKLNGENVDIQMSTLMLNCTFLAFFERSLISTLWVRLYNIERRHNAHCFQSNYHYATDPSVLPKTVLFLQNKQFSPKTSGA